MADPIIKAAKSILDAQLFGIMSPVSTAVEYETTPTGVKIKTPVPTVRLKRRVEPHDNLIGLCTTVGDQLTFLVKSGRDGVPEVLSLDADGRTEEIAVEVIECGEVTFLAELTERIRPVQGGYSIGNRRFDNAGTLGAWVKIANEHDGHTGWIGLSNNHVFAGYDGAGQIDDNIVQPGVIDGADEAVGRLVYGHPINIEGTNVIDFAYCTPLSTNLMTPEIHEVGPVRGIIEPDRDMDVEKVGRTTGRTTGCILATDATIEVSDPSLDKTVTFTHQISMDCEIRCGDSGSILLEQGTGMMVGLCFAGGDFQFFANHVAFLFEIPDLPPEALVDITGGLTGLSPLLQLQPS
ncbi:hypothetical protein IH992_26700 [Candidatus Poribacteria bacterium]|nr:hypothetical protein [Candidatus Poribacteria bacterium]